MIVLRAAALGLALAFASVPAGAMPDEVHQEVAAQAARLMPTSLRSVLASHLDELRQGAGAPLGASEEGLFLYPDGAYGSLDRTVDAQAARVVEMLRQRAPMAMVVKEMGVLSRAVALASDPVHVTVHDQRTSDWADDYARFVESRRPRFRVAFGGYASPDLDRGDVAAFVRSAAERTRSSSRLLPSLFLLDDGSVAKISGFDDRHPAFGVASIGYSHAVTDTARLWLYVWIQAGGDSAGLPFPQSLPQGAGARR
jgi:hypothetical protein